MLTAALLAVVISIGRFDGPALPGSDPTTAKFAVHVHGSAAQRVRVRALDVPAGYVASFCTAHLCAPFAVTVTLPPSGEISLELQLIENRAGATKPDHVTVAADGAKPASIRFSLAARSPRSL